MTQGNEQNRTELLDRAAAALREAVIPAGPSEQLVASTVEALQTVNIPPEILRFRERRRKMFSIARYSGASAAAVFLVGIATWLFMMDRTATLAFGDVVANIRNAKTITFVSQMPSNLQGKPGGVLQQKWYIQGETLRMDLPSAQQGVTIPADAPPVLIAIIADSSHKQALQLDYVAKTAKRIKADDKRWRESAKILTNPIEAFRKLKSTDAERLGEDTLNGKKVEVYRLKQLGILDIHLTDGDTAKLWADAKTGLPVRIAVEAAGKNTPSLVLEQFRWNEPLDPALFSVEVPKGFRVVDE